jgi:hypothetical protein
MKYEIDLPAQLDVLLNQRAAVVGGDVVHLIQLAVTEFVERDMPAVASSGRLPDPVAFTNEISAPIDLPRNEADFIVPDIVIDGSARVPDLPPMDR